MKNFSILILTVVILVWLSSLKTSFLYSGKNNSKTVTVISDSLYNTADWSVVVNTDFGAGETHEQRLNGGNPGAYRYMEHTLPSPPGDNDLAKVEVAHIYNSDAYLPLSPIDHIDYAEDIRLLNISWEQAFIRSYPAIRQSGRLYRATEYISVIADTVWRNGSITGLTANDFIALDGSGDHPDFSDHGDFLYFGFWRISTRSGLLPPIPAEQELIYQHGSDNFTVTIYDEPATNSPPTARSDEYLYLDYFFNTSKDLYVLENDSDPENDPIRIFNVAEPAFGGIIESFSDSTISYSAEGLFSSRLESDFFLYTITDEQNVSTQAFVTMHFCVCPIECIFLFLSPHYNNVMRTAAEFAEKDTLDIELFRRFRDDILLSTEKGSRFVDLYYHNAPEIMPLLLFDRQDLGFQALSALEMMQEPLRNLLDGDGSMLISQSLVDSVSAFLDNLLMAASDSLRDSLNLALTGLGPLQDLVGLTVADALEKVTGDSASTNIDDRNMLFFSDFILEQNYPNPFNPVTKINYILPEAAEVKLQIYFSDGQEVKVLVNEFQTAGRKSVVWNGTDDNGKIVTSGIYFYRLKAGNKFIDTKKLVLLK